MTLDELIEALEEKRGHNNVNGHHEINLNDVREIMSDHNVHSDDVRRAIKQERGR